MGSKQYSSPPEMSIDPNLTYSATIKTAGGDIVLRLYARQGAKHGKQLRVFWPVTAFTTV